MLTALACAASSAVLLHAVVLPAQHSRLCPVTCYCGPMQAEQQSAERPQAPAKHQKSGTEGTPGATTESAAPSEAAGSDSMPVRVEAPPKGVKGIVPVPALHGPLSAAGDDLKQPDPSTAGAAAAPQAAAAASAEPEPKSAEPAVPQQSCMAKPVLSARGHTGYLTFARRHID